MAIEDDDKPRKKVSHEIGQDLSLLSVEELTERIALLDVRNRTAASRDDEEARAPATPPTASSNPECASDAIGSRARLPGFGAASATGRYGK